MVVQVVRVLLAAFLLSGCAANPCRPLLTREGRWNICSYEDGVNDWCPEVLECIGVKHNRPELSR